MSDFEKRRPPCILYLSMLPGNPGQEQKLAGIRRYCSARGWRAEAISRTDFSSERLSGILRESQPAGCVVEGIGNQNVPPPRLFGPVPVAYLECPPEVVEKAPNILVDDAAIAREAVRELSAGQPSCYAAVGSMLAHRWARLRLRAFRAAVAAETGKRCVLFPMSPLSRGTIPYGDYFKSLVAWVAALPRHCAVFAASDLVACRVAEAARAAFRAIPRDLTLLSTDNHAELCEAASPPISSIQIDLERMGYLAARCLGEKTSHRGTETQRQGKHTDLLTPNGVRGNMSRVSGEQIRVLDKNLCGSMAPCDKKSFTVSPLLTMRRKSTGGRGRREPWVLDAVATIRAKACEGLSAADLIARFPVSKRLFTLRFREATGHSVFDEILHVRLEKAYTLLSQTDTAIGAIPFLCGFRSERTLEALFRDRSGLSMRDWRRRNAT